MQSPDKQLIDGVTKLAYLSCCTYETLHLPHHACEYRDTSTCLLLCGSGLPSGSMSADRYAPTLHGALPQPAFRPISGQSTLTIALASLPTSVQSDSHTISYAVTSLYNAGMTLPSCSDQHLSTAPLISNLLRHRRASALSR